MAAGPLGRAGQLDRCIRSRPILTGRPASELPLDKLKVPAGFKVEVCADGIPEARSLALGDKGTVFVSNRNLKDVYAIVDRAASATVKKMLKGLNSPNGVAFSKGTLYVAERHRITAYDGIEDRLDNPPEARVVIDNLDPTKQAGHFWKFLAIGPDGKLYFNVGAPGNIVMPSYQQATINRVDPQTGVMETYAQRRAQLGRLRLASAARKQLWFTNHARDWVSDDMPHDTLHRAAKKGMHFGYPFCHQGDFLDPEFGKGRACNEFDAPAAKLGAHIAPLGMRFYTGRMFPAEYRDNIFIAMHGSWNRTTKQGYNVMRATVDAQRQGRSSSPSSRASSPTRRPIRRCGAGRSTCWYARRRAARLRRLQRRHLPGQLRRSERSRRLRRGRGGARRGRLLARAVAAPAAARTDAQREKAALVRRLPRRRRAARRLPDIPSLAGQPKQFITTQLVMFREGNRKNPHHDAARGAADQRRHQRARQLLLGAGAGAARHAARRATPPRRRAAWPSSSTAWRATAPTLQGQQHIPRLAGQQRRLPARAAARLQGGHALRHGRQHDRRGAGADAGRHRDAGELAQRAAAERLASDASHRTSASTYASPSPHSA